MKRKFRIEGTVETVPEKKVSGIDFDTIMYRSLESLEAENDLRDSYDDEDDDDISPEEFLRRLYS